MHKNTFRTPMIAKVLLLSIIGFGVGHCTNVVRITNESVFIDFSNNVNSGTSYKETTVFLDADLDFSGGLSEQFEPIGKNYNYFQGIFNGQGYTISSFTVNVTSLRYVGLFGRTNGATIRNVVLDSSCTITSLYVGSSDVHIGGIAGYCSESAIENSINMASISFSGRASWDMYTGGIVGYFDTYNYEGGIKNCANYGKILNNGSSWDSYLGGIVGKYYLYKAIWLRNCLNYGNIKDNGSTKQKTYIGGITGYSSGSEGIENCVNLGRFSAINSKKYIGGIGGYLKVSNVYNCYWDKASCTDASGSFPEQTPANSASFSNTTFELDEAVSVGNYTGTSLIDALNAAADYYYLRGYSHWLLNKDNKNVSFTVNGVERGFTLTSQLVLLPNLANEGKVMFDGWYTDSSCTKPLTDFEIASDAPLYGKWEENNNHYTISFDTRRDVSIKPISAQFKVEVSLSNGTAEREGCRVAWWETDYGDIVPFDFIVPARDITLHAVWLCTHISTAEDLVDFSISLNRDITCSQDPVFLDADIDFSRGLSERYEPINGWLKNIFKYFDGQGHTISNLVVNSTSYECTGLFGCISGAIIRNVVLDSSCSFTGSYWSGGIVAECRSYNDTCLIENNVNMASITFYGSYPDSLYIGGIVGTVIWKEYQTAVRNNANYGTIANYGNNANYGTNTNHGRSSGVCIGGIIGRNEGAPDTKIYSNLNYGNILHAGNSTYAPTVIGGIVGLNSYSEIENSVNLGKISSVAGSEYTGGIAGMFWYTTVSNCFWSSEYNLSASSIELTTTIKNCATVDTTTFKLSGWASGSQKSYTGKSLVDELNTVASAHTIQAYSHWVFNKDRKTLSFTINGKAKTLTLNSQLILLPNLASDEIMMMFDGWYTDSGCAKPLNAFSVNADTRLYGKWEENKRNYTVTFDTHGGGSVGPFSVAFGDVVTLPEDEVAKKDYMLLRWDTENGETASWKFVMPGHDITLHAVWLPMNVRTAEQLIEVSKALNNGINPNKVVVLLDSDIDFGPELSKEFEGIGKEWSNPFLGTFDGQGHVIRNLVMNSTAKSVGVIGYTERSLITNVVLDSSCTVTGTRSTNAVDEWVVSVVGGLVGVCDASPIENVVNMASVTYSGVGAGYESYIGGIAGIFYNTGEPYQGKYNGWIINSVNYGPVSHTGSSKLAYIGGIAGDVKEYVENSANYGTITHNGRSEEAYIGGIAGYGRGYIEWCLSAGTIQWKRGQNIFAGSIFGGGDSPEITNCTWTYDVGTDNVIGDNLSYSYIKDITFAEQLNTTIVDEMNDAANEVWGWTKWIILYLDEGKVNGLSQNILVVTQRVLPVPGKAGYKFTFWCKNEDCSEVYDPLTSNMTEINELYAQYVLAYGVTFDYGNGTTTENILAYNETIVYPPDPVREGYAFIGWSSNIERVPGHNITITALWAGNPSMYVEVVIRAKNMSEEQIKEALKEFTDDQFTIDYIETDGESGDTIVIIKFTSVDKAVSFVRNVTKNARENPNSFIRKATMTTKKQVSFSVKSLPISQLLTFLLFTLAF